MMIRMIAGIRIPIVAMALAASLLLSPVLAEVPAPKSVHRIQVSRHADAFSADVAESRLALQGLGPIHRQVSGEEVVLYVGKFETNSEAWAWSQELKKSGVLGTSPAAFPNDAGEQFASEFHSELTPLLIPRSISFQPTAISREQLLTDPRAAGFGNALQEHERDLVIASGTALIEQLPDSDPLKGRVLVEVGRAIVRNEKESVPALPYLMKVARGEVRSCEQDLVEARFMVADSWHYYWFAPLKAFRAYKEILEAHGQDAGVAARCRVEMAACMLEMARMPQAEWKPEFDDVRRYCQLVLELTPPAYRRAHAVAGLMHAETWLYASLETPVSSEAKTELLARSYDELSYVRQQFPERIREVSMANHLLGYVAAEMGNWESSRAYYEANLILEIPSASELFFWKGEASDQRVNSLARLRHFAFQFQDTEAFQGYNSMVESGDFKTPAVGAPESDFDTAFPHILYQERSVE